MRDMLRCKNARQWLDVKQQVWQLYIESWLLGTDNLLVQELALGYTLGMRYLQIYLASAFGAGREEIKTGMEQMKFSNLC